MNEFSEIYLWIGYLAAFLTTSGFLPQVIQVYKTNRTEDLSLKTFSMLSLGVLMWFIYGVGLTAYPIIIANGITLILVSYIMFKIIINEKNNKKH